MSDATDPSFPPSSAGNWISIRGGEQCVNLAHVKYIEVKSLDNDTSRSIVYFYYSIDQNEKLFATSEETDQVIQSLANVGIRVNRHAG